MTCQPTCIIPVDQQHMNTLTYILYLFLTYLITIHVGLSFYRNGRIYILGLLHGDDRLTDFINKALLTGYYLLNLGYAALMLRTWETVTSWPQLVAGIATMTGRIMLLLALVHWCNMAIIYLIGQKRNQSLHYKK